MLGQYLMLQLQWTGGLSWRRRKYKTNCLPVYDIICSFCIISMKEINKTMLTSFRNLFLVFPLCALCKHDEGLLLKCIWKHWKSTNFIKSIIFRELSYEWTTITLSKRRILDLLPTRSRFVFKNNFISTSVILNTHGTRWAMPVVGRGKTVRFNIKV